MTSSDLVLKWVWPNPEDLRNSDLYSNLDSKEVKEFTFETLPGDMLFVTYFFRFNHHTGRFEEAGRVEWYPGSERHGTVYFGERQVNTESLSRRKKATSRSRRFKSNKGSEYKWKKGSDVGLHELDFVCVDSWRRVVGKWIQASQTLTMTSGGFAIFDELVALLSESRSLHRSLPKDLGSVKRGLDEKQNETDLHKDIPSLPSAGFDPRSCRTVDPSRLSAEEVVAGKNKNKKAMPCKGTVEGLSIDFTSLNVVGFASYAFYATTFMFNEDVREEYRRRHNGHNNSVQLNDVAFAIHASKALVLTVIVLSQTFYYPRGPGQQLSPFNRAAIIFMAVVFFVDVGRIAVSQAHLIDVLYHLGTFKLYVSIAKYIPQARSNFKRRSTEGWSIGNVLLDFTGGLLSLLQLLIDSFALNDWSAITGNPVKFGLSMFSLGFGLLFLLQHYVWFAKNRPSDDVLSNDADPTRDQARPLLG
ncbi:hypothetical protein FRC06_009613 [Ceratobasidium sp. 370]|nr:hypothetical protein FRC06_009613 [Ceratobasidium sp. 370]